MFKVVVVLVALLGVLVYYASLTEPVALAKACDGHTCRRVVVPLPSVGFDATEMAMPCSLLAKLGHTLVFATKDGKPSEGADPLTLTGMLGGLLAKPSAAALADYASVVSSDAYKNPVPFSALSAHDYDGVLLVGGHHPGMDEFLREELLRPFLADMLSAEDKRVAAVCHGVLHLSRAGLISDRTVTAVPRRLERIGVVVTEYVAGLPSASYQLSTTGNAWVQDEVEPVAGTFLDGSLPLAADVLVHPLVPPSWTDAALTRAFVVVDRNLVTARFWGDAPAFAHAFAASLLSIEE
eukprot:TRINITY_DN9943_c0_g1_i1.p1 TRINITY_DN9943_c0_g1~~TRINITY_DN9943_c0_g1_i1.p1  ORF type:complete len:295 (+),score=68.03 TRINITY_DN9943_c0_g1_i1:166-1050(+)